MAISDNQSDDNSAPRQYMTLESVWIDLPSGKPEGQAERERVSQKNQPYCVISDGDWYNLPPKQNIS